MTDRTARWAAAMAEAHHETAEPMVLSPGDLDAHTVSLDPGDATCASCGSLIDVLDPQGTPTSCPPCVQRSNAQPPLDEVQRQVHAGNLAFVPLTAGQLDLLMEAVGSYAGRLVDEAPDPDAYVPFANLQGYLGRFATALEVPPSARGLSDREAREILARVLAAFQVEQEVASTP